MTQSTQTYPNPQPSPPPAPPTSPPRAPSVPATPAGDDRPRKTGRGVGLGIVLIALGAAMLWAQFLPGVEWMQLWPLIIVAVGLGQMVTPGWGDERGVMRVMDGFGTVLIGLVFLGNTLGYIAWSVWFVLLTLWPVLLIAAGISIIGKGIGQQWLRALAPLVIWAALGLAVASSLTAKAPVTVPQTITIQPTTVPFIIIDGK